MSNEEIFDKSKTIQTGDSSNFQFSPNRNKVWSEVGLGMAYHLVAKLLEKWNDGSSWVNEIVVLSELRQKFPNSNPNPQCIKELIEFINSVIPNSRIVDRYKKTEGMRSAWIISEANQATLKMALLKIEALL